MVNYIRHWNCDGLPHWLSSTTLMQLFLNSSHHLHFLMINNCLHIARTFYGKFDLNPYNSKTQMAFCYPNTVHSERGMDILETHHQYGTANTTLLWEPNVQQGGSHHIAWPVHTCSSIKYQVSSPPLSTLFKTPLSCSQMLHLFEQGQEPLCTMQHL
jgi:hypothetical protein